MYATNPKRTAIWARAGKTTNANSHTNLILGSTECKKVVGEEMNWQMGLEVAVEINLKTLSAAKPPVGNQRTQFPASPLLLPVDALTSKFLFFEIKRKLGDLLQYERRGKQLGCFGGKFKIRVAVGWIRDLKLGLNTKWKGDLTVGIGL